MCIVLSRDDDALVAVRIQLSIWDVCKILENESGDKLAVTDCGIYSDYRILPEYFA